MPLVLGRAGNIEDYFPSEAREIIGEMFPALPNTIVIAVRHDGVYVDETAHFTHTTGISGYKEPLLLRRTHF